MQTKHPYEIFHIATGLCLGCPFALVPQAINTVQKCRKSGQGRLDSAVRLWLGGQGATTTTSLDKRKVAASVDVARSMLTLNQQQTCGYWCAMWEVLTKGCTALGRLHLRVAVQAAKPGIREGTLELEIPQGADAKAAAFARHAARISKRALRGSLVATIAKWRRTSGYRKRRSDESAESV